MMLLATSTISAGKALMNTLIGMGTVFLVLIFISFIISLFKYINQADTKKPIEAAPIPPAPVIETVEEPEEELADDTELVAVITAAIAAYAGTSSEGFQVRSIKRAAKSAWK